MKSSSIKELVKQHPSISPRVYRDILIHEWHIPPEYKDILWMHEIYKIPSSILMNKVDEGTIIWKQRVFYITWISGPRTIRINENAIISFRFCTKLRSGYALIKVWDRESSQDNIRDIDTRMLG